MYEKIGLGTAQWGMDYGVNNTLGKTNFTDISRILQKASEMRINTIDTARLYGESESTIGKFNLDNFLIVTKTNKFDSIAISDYEVNLLEQDFFKSLECLNLNSIYGLLIHRGNDLLKENSYKLIQKLKELKEKGFINKIGVSIYEVSEIQRILEIFVPDIVQIPFNVFSQKFLNSGMLKYLKSYDIEIHARSIFLQGILLMRREEMPSYFTNWEKEFIHWEEFCKKNKLSKMQAAINFVKSVEYIDKIILGFDRFYQFYEFLRNIELLNNFSKNINYGSLNIDDSNLCNPSRWKV